MPYSGCSDVDMLSNIRAGVTPRRPSEGIYDQVWQLLEKCWSRKPPERPSATRVYNTLSKFRSVRPAMEELPARLELEVQSIKISLTRAEKRQFFVKFKYGNEGHTTPLTMKAAGGDEYTWFAFGPPLPLVLSLSLKQELSRSLVDRN